MLAIIDGDILCYQVCEARWKQRCENGTLIVSLDQDGNELPLEFSKEEDKNYLMKSWDNFKKELKNLLDTVYADDFLMAVKGPDNYRDLLYPEYKANRKNKPDKQNHFVPVMRELAVMEELAVPSVGREADDLVRIWSEEARKVGQDFIVCTIDKDLKCIPGRHYQMPIKTSAFTKKGKFFEMSEEDAQRFYYEQLLKGDPTDNIPGIPGLGPVSATKFLAPFTKESEFQEEVVNRYLMAYGEVDWLDQLNSNGKMIHIQKEIDDYFDCLQWPVVRELI